MGKHVRFYGRPGALVVFADRNKILLDKHSRDVVDGKQLPGERRLVRLGVALREVES